MEGDSVKCPIEYVSRGKAVQALERHHSFKSVNVLKNEWPDLLQI